MRELHERHDRDPHRDVESLEEVLRPRVYERRDVANVLPAAGQECDLLDLLVRSRALCLERLEHPALRFGMGSPGLGMGAVTRQGLRLVAPIKLGA
jgi:hypothetical protein